MKAILRSKRTAAMIVVAKPECISQEYFGCMHNWAPTECRPDNLAMAGVLIGAALKADERDWETIHLWDAIGEC